MPLFTLLNTRPSHQASGLNAAVEKVGAIALTCPTMQIEQMTLPKQISSLATFDKVIFISANAVKAFVKLDLPMDRLPTLFAIGKATIKAGQDAGLNMISASGQQFDSEALLQHSELQQLTDQKILIVKGEKGRTLLAETLQTRGALVEQWPLYCRQAVPLCAEQWPIFKQAVNPVVLATSITGLHYLLEAFEQQNSEQINNPNVQNKTEQAWSETQLSWLLNQSLVVFSQRIKEWAIQQNWHGKIAVVATQSDQGIVDCIMDSFVENKLKQNREQG
ncbi:MAG: uroporphyrinogen-III synthase [Pseudomonadota bacterium]|nr:uroporphyrinogen-III synthase [Pseudomonadota bacterium]